MIVHPLCQKIEFSQKAEITLKLVICQRAVLPVQKEQYLFTFPCCPGSLILYLRNFSIDSACGRLSDGGGV
jgi:hypothetical protein